MIDPNLIASFARTRLGAYEEKVWMITLFLRCGQRVQTCETVPVQVNNCVAVRFRQVTCCTGEFRINAGRVRDTDINES